VVAEAQLQFAEGRRIERIATQTIAISDRLDLLNAAPGTFDLSNCNGAVEGDDRRWPDGK